MGGEGRPQFLWMLIQSSGKVRMSFHIPFLSVRVAYENRTAFDVHYHRVCHCRLRRQHGFVLHQGGEKV